MMDMKLTKEYRPQHYRLLCLDGFEIVIWRDASGEWRAQQDGALLEWTSPAPTRKEIVDRVLHVRTHARWLEKTA